MAATGRFWWMTPLQSFTTFGAAFNMGGSSLQSPLIMPMLQMPTIAHQPAASMTANLLHNSEYFFPPLNAICTLSNLVMTIFSYLNRDTDRTASAKLPYLAAQTALSIATTAWSLGIQVPINNRIIALSKNLEANPQDEKSAKEFRELQKKWKVRNYGRACLMLATAVSGFLGLLEDGAAVRL